MSSRSGMTPPHIHLTPRSMNDSSQSVGEITSNQFRGQKRSSESLCTLDRILARLRDDT
eukprot:gene15936-4816_t